MVRIILSILLFSYLCDDILIAQNYLGAGNSTNITITSSDNYQDHRWSQSSGGMNTVNGAGMNDARFRAARLLLQGSIGFDDQHLDEVLQLGEEGWIDAQFAKPMNKVLPALEQIFGVIVDTLEKYNESIPTRPNWRHFNYAWWQQNMIQDDLLRHKVACALSEILVISRNSDLSNYGYALASYYDVLYEHAFGRFNELLLAVTLHPAMGYYLSHANNPKSDTTIGRFPDENYARELMQLFSIGLFQLNEDGTPILDAQQQKIPTYDNDDVIEFAKIFTGLSYGAIRPGLNKELRFGISKNDADMSVPMIMYDVDDPSTNRTDEDQHEDGAKTLLNEFPVPPNQTGMQDIEMAITHLFDHPNVGPFIAYRLIQRLVKSNPSPSYVGRVAQVFANDGQGVRGNMQAVVKAILIDDEARSCAFLQSDIHARLKEPIFRYTQFTRAVDKDAPSNFIWNYGKDFGRDAGQEILAAPSVFNFFLPIEAPNGEIEDLGLVAPEFGLHDTKYSVGYINEVYDWTRNGKLMRISEKKFGEDIRWDITALMPIAEDIEVYINWMDNHLTHGQLRDETRSILRHALGQISPSRSNYLEDRIRLGMYIVLIAPEYNIHH